MYIITFFIILESSKAGFLSNLFSYEKKDQKMNQGLEDYSELNAEQNNNDSFSSEISTNQAFFIKNDPIDTKKQNLENLIYFSKKNNKPHFRSELDSHKISKSSIGMQGSPIPFSVESSIKPDLYCNPDLLEYLGFKLEKNFERPSRSNAMLKSYCRKNKNSCCSNNEILSMQKAFNIGVESFERLMKPIEELLSLTNGHALENKLKKRKNDISYRCFRTTQVKNFEGQVEDITSNAVFQKGVEQARENLIELETYMKNHLSFYANIICTACDPMESSFFEQVGGVLKVTALVEVCQEMVMLREFEVNFLKNYILFFKPLYNLFNCLEGSEEVNNDLITDKIDWEYIRNLHLDYRNCDNQFSIENLACQRICAKNLNKLEFSYKVFLEIDLVLNKLFGILSGESLVDFYHRVYSEVYFSSEVHGSIRFFPLKKGQKGEKKIGWDFGLKGINIASNKMSRKFGRK